MYIAPGQWQTAPRGQNLHVNRKALSFYPFVASFKEISFKSDYIHFFLFNTCIQPRGRGHTGPRGQTFVVNRNVLSLHSFVASLKKMSLKSDFIQFFFHVLIHVYSPRQWQTAPRGQSFDVNRKALSLYPFVASFKEISLKSDFIHFFHDLIHVYSPGAGGIQPPPPGDKVLISTLGHLLLVSNYRRQ